MIVMLTPRKSFDDAVASLRAGAVDIVLKTPESVAYLKERIMQAASRSADKREVDSLLAEVREVHEAFLERFMAAERRALDVEDRLLGRDPSEGLAVSIRTLVVDPEPSLNTELSNAAPPGFEFVPAFSGGQALDQCGTSRFQMALVKRGLHDLPSSILVRNLKAQNSDMMVLDYQGPGQGGTVDLVDVSGRGQNQTLVADFRSAQDLVAQLGELSAAFREREKERRYVEQFRERHYDFLRKFVMLKAKIQRAVQ